MSRWIYRAGGIALCLAAGVLFGCGLGDSGVGTTSDNDFTLALHVVNQSVHRNDQAIITLRLRRTDNSNLPRGMGGVIVITTSEHGSVDVSRVSFSVADDTTREFVEQIVFTAGTAGIAEVRATYVDATALVKILISKVDISGEGE